MAADIDFWFNYSCPLSFLTRRLLLRAAQESGARIRSHPFEHRPGIRNAVFSQRVWEHTVLPLAARLDVPMGEAPPMSATDTRPASRGYRYARDRKRGEAYSDQVFSAHFQEQAGIGDPAVLEQLAGRAGLDPGEFRAALAARERTEHPRPTPEEGKIPVTLTPTIVSGHLRIEGVPTAEQFHRLLQGAGSGRLSRPGGNVRPSGRSAASDRAVCGRQDRTVVEVVECGLH
ncbi:DsbA family protein [Streptomyces sp. NPDC051207]|uniref:DsbA family oxidoreductase n=1 Tax=Streptomyces sp. NPDC051207 TaxID=3154641 RepID=UPI0034473826